MIYTVPVGHILICNDSERPKVHVRVLSETDFRVLQAMQDTGCRLRFVTRDCNPLFVASGFAIRNTFWCWDISDIFDG